MERRRGDPEGGRTGTCRAFVLGGWTHGRFRKNQGLGSTFKVTTEVER